MKTLYITDLDGTLLNNDAELSEFTAKTLNKLIKKGMLFSVATARTLASASRILSGLNLNMPVILMNGVIIYDMQKMESLNVEYIKHENALKIISILNEFNLSAFMYEIRGNTVIAHHEELKTTSLQEFYQKRINNNYKYFNKVDSIYKTCNENIAYFTMFDEKSRLEPIYKQLNTIQNINATLYSDTYATNKWFLEIYSNQASKYYATQYLKRKFNIDRTVVFGDNLNDIPLFKAGDEKYAVENAKEELKKLATDIIMRNDQDGVVHWLNKFAVV